MPRCASDTYRELPMPHTGRSLSVSTVEMSTPDVAAPREFWLRGDTAMCACPDCSAPMSIRLWLMVADCWLCGTSVELSEQQEREIQALLRQQDDTEPLPEKTLENNGVQACQQRQADLQQRPTKQSPSARPRPIPLSKPQPTTSLASPAAADKMGATMSQFPTAPRRLRAWLQHLR